MRAIVCINEDDDTVEVDIDYNLVKYLNTGDNLIIKADDESYYALKVLYKVLDAVDNILVIETEHLL
jgi:hypothetical protein